MIMEPITISVPTYLKYGIKKPKTFALNLNVYRNTHFHILNQMKELFGKKVEKAISQLPIMSKVKLTYSLFFGSKRDVDTANVCCIVDKFFSDCLVNAGKLPDDNSGVISEVTYRFGGIDTRNPRCDVTLSEIEVVEMKEDPMRIILVQAEIELALRQYVFSQINIAEGQDISIDFKNTRGEDGATAEINITKPEMGNVEKSTQKPVESVSPAPATKTQPKASTASPAPAATATKPTAMEPVQSAPSASSTTAPIGQASTEPEKEEDKFNVPAFLQRKSSEEPVEEATEEPAPVTKPVASAAPTANAGKSLFANLTPVSNKKPEAEA